MAMKSLVIQHENIKKTLKSMESRPESSISSDRSSSLNNDFLVLDESQRLYYQNEMFDVGSQNIKKREAVVIAENDENMYMNEVGVF